MSRPVKRWFRFYVEAAHDMKLRKLTPAQRWLWVAVLSATRESPVTGKLMASQSLAVDELMLSDYAGMRVQDVRTGLKLMDALGLIEWDDELKTWSVPRWSERQFESDDVTKRTAKHRSEKQLRNVPNQFPGTTLQQFRNIPDTDTDTDTELKREVKTSLLPKTEILDSELFSETIPETSRTTPANGSVAESFTAFKTQPLPPSDLTPTNNSPAKSLTTSVGVQKKTKKLDLLFEAIAEVCGINWRCATESELGQLRKSRREIGNVNGTPDEVYRKAPIYHKMFPGVILTPMALSKFWSTLEESNIPKTSRERQNEELEMAYEEAINTLAECKEKDDCAHNNDSLVECADVTDRSRSTKPGQKCTPQVVMVETLSCNDADTSNPQWPATSHQEPPDADSRRDATPEHDFQPQPFESASNRSTDAPVIKATYPMTPSFHTGSLPVVSQLESQATLASEKPKPSVSKTEAQCIRETTRSLISQLAREKQMDLPKKREPVV